MSATGRKPEYGESVSPAGASTPRELGELRYRALFNAIDEGFCIIEVMFDDQRRCVDFRYLEANPALERLTGLTAVEGRTARELAPGLEQYWFDVYGQVALTGEGTRFVMPSSALAGRWFDVFAFRVDAPDQGHVAVLFSDITRRKQAEMELRQNQHRLTEAAARLRNADRRKDEFLATLAHELRNPLAPIRNGVQILRLATVGNQALQRTTDMMERQMCRLVRLVDDLLDISRIGRGKIELRRDRVVLNDAITCALESCETLFEPHGHELRVRIPEEPLVVLGDRDRLTQVFSNLLSNAAKFTPRGGTVSVSLERIGEEAVASVLDTGIGIPPERLQSVFEMFSQVHSPRSNDGLGIGLALVRQLVRLHGGDVTVKSEGPGYGSCFAVRLPLVEDIVHRRPRTGSATRPSALGRIPRKVLVADDNPDAAQSLARLLTLQGHDVSICASGVEAVVCAKLDPPDVIFMDLEMPGMDGLSAARMIRAQAGAAPLRIVALTGWGQETDRERSREAGMDDHLMKPASPDSLRQIL